jgi:uncharacterized protein (TIGR03435 family)
MKRFCLRLLSGAGSLFVSFAPTLLPQAEWPSIFIAVEEQLGLKLKSAHSPVDTLVVD